MTVDAVAIAAHPDDVELMIGGTIAKLTDRGKSVAIIDLTRGELGSRGTPETRAAEAAAAAEALGVCERINLDLGDGRLENTHENRALVITHLRRLRPSIVMTQYWEDLHPDHAATGDLVKDIMYPIGFEKFPADGQPYRPNEFLFAMAHFDFDPSFIVDVTGYWDRKQQAIHCYKSQLHDPDSTGPATNIARPDFIQRIEARARHFGTMILTDYGEPFLVRRPVPVDDPVDHYAAFHRF
ncbi:MAG: bacillithiol biosynthesis deacetylase BshB1 [Planctomycetaceae bacterium]|nr:bacillithiol biosynthesis deacetylase BshB1 [Planctomycetaceae bacterium]